MVIELYDFLHSPYTNTQEKKLKKNLNTFLSETKRQISEFNSRKEDFLHIRYELLYQALLHFFSANMKNEIEQEKLLVRKIHEIGLDVKQSKDNVIIFFNAYIQK